MSQQRPRTWYRVAIACRDGERLVAAEGEHVGGALAAAELHASGRAFAVEVASASEVPLGESVGKHRVVELTTAAPHPPRDQWPVGVLPSFERLPDVTAGYIEHRDATLVVLEAQVARDQCHELFLSLIERLPAADNLEVRVLPHYDAGGGPTDVWLTSRVDARRILRFLDDHDELLDNGHLEVSVYVRKHAATLRLTEHKTVAWLAEHGALCGEVAEWLGELGVARVDELVTIGSVPHVHYRPAKSRDREKLGEHLYRQRLRKVAVIEDDAR